MLRKLLTTTALAALLATGAVAQDAPATTETNIAAPASALLSSGYASVDTDNLATKIIGMPVYSSTAADADNFGEINDLVVNADGTIAAVIIGVGGFLGLGEKGVAISYAELEWAVAEDQTERFVLNTTREALEAAPAFEWRDDVAANGNAMAPAEPQGTTAEPLTNPDGSKMDRSAMTDFDELSVTAEDLKGTPVYGVNDEQIGSVSDFVLGEDGKTVDALILDVGGFLGLGQKPVAVGFENLNFSVDANNNRYLFVNLTKEQLEAQPEFNRDTYLTERDAQRIIIAP